MSVKSLVRGLPKSEQEAITTYWRILRVLVELHHDEKNIPVAVIASQLTVAVALWPEPSGLIIPPE